MKKAGRRRSKLPPPFHPSSFILFFLLLVPIASGLPPKPAKSPAKAANAQPVPVARWTFDNEVGIRIKQHKSIAAITSGVNNYLWNAKRLPEGEWVQIACTFDGDKTVFYVNGEALENPPDAMGSKKTQNFGSKMTVGSNAFNGAIDDLRIYDTALTPEQITAAEND